MAAKRDLSDVELISEVRKTGVRDLAQVLALVVRGKQVANRPDVDAGDVKDLLFDAARSSVRSHLDWVTLGTRGLDSLLDSLAGPEQPNRRKPAIVPLRLRVRPGEQAKAHFQVVNPHDHEAIVSFTRPQLQKGENETLPEVVFSRADGSGNSFAVAAKKRATFAATLQIGENISPGLYRGEAAVVVEDVVAGRLRIEVQVDTLPAIPVSITVAVNNSATVRLHVSNPLSQPANARFALPIAWQPAGTATTPLVAATTFSGAAVDQPIPAGSTVPCDLTINATSGDPKTTYRGEALVLGNGQPLAKLVVEVTIP